MRPTSCHSSGPTLRENKCFHSRRYLQVHRRVREGLRARGDLQRDGDLDKGSEGASREIEGQSKDRNEEDQKRISEDRPMVRSREDHQSRDKNRDYNALRLVLIPDLFNPIFRDSHPA